MRLILRRPFFVVAQRFGADAGSTISFRLSRRDSTRLASVRRNLAHRRALSLKVDPASRPRLNQRRLIICKGKREPTYCVFALFIYNYSVKCVAKHFLTLM